MTLPRRTFTGAPWESKVGYCRAIRRGGIIAVTGTVSLDARGELHAPGDPYGQTKRCLEIIEAAIQKLGAKREDILRTRIFVTDISLWQDFGRAHGEFFKDCPPATSMVEVKSLIDPRMLVEIEADAVLEPAPTAGQLHHVELYVSDLRRSTEFWGWLLDRFGYSKVHAWEQGESWKLGHTYLVFVQTEPDHLEAGYHRKRTGLNHVALHAESREQVDELKAALLGRGVNILYEGKHPDPAAKKMYALFFEDPDRIKVEVVTS